MAAVKETTPAGPIPAGGLQEGEKMTTAEKMKLYNTMRCDISVMNEHGDNEQSLYDEIMTADDEILETYAETFLR